MVILIIILLSSILIAVSNIEKKDQTINENNDTLSKITNTTWFYLKSDFYNLKKESSTAILNSFELIFHDKYLEICFEETCFDSEYTIEDNVLTIKSIDGFAGKNIISLEEENLSMEHYFEDGTRMMYYLEKAKG